MVEGNFTVNTSNKVPFTNVGVDHEQERRNKRTKGVDGISGITTSPQTLLKFCLSAPELSILALEIEEMLVLGLNEHTKHYSDNEPKINRQEKSICHLNKVLMTPLKT